MSDDLVITSTTDDATAIEAALTAVRGVPADAAPEEEEVTAGTPPAADAAVIEEPEAGEEKPEKVEAPAPKDEKPAAKDEPQEARKSRLLKRVDDLTWEKNEAKRVADAERARAERLEAELSVLRSRSEEPVEVKEAPEPKAEEFSTQEDYEKALHAWTATDAAQRIVKETLEAEREKDLAARQAADDAQTLKRFEETKAEARTRYPDFDAVVTGPEAKALNLTGVMTYVIMNSDVGHDIAYHLMKHPEEAQKIAKLDGQAAVLAMGRLEGRIEDRVEQARRAAAPAAAEPSDESDESEEPEEPAAVVKPKPKAVTKAPEPVTPVGARAAASTVPLDEMEFQQFAAVRRQQEMARRSSRR